MTYTFLLLLCLAALPALGQDTEDVTEEVTEVEVAFDSLRVRTVAGRTVAEWLRPVLKQEDFRLSAHNGFDEGNGFILFWGDVEITEAGDTIRAERVRYQREDRIGEARGAVRLTDGQVVLEAPFARYFSRDEVTIFEEGVTYRDSTSVLTARWARYASAENRAEFAREVTLTQSDLTLFADSILLARETEESRAWGRIAADHLNESDSVRTLMLADSLYRNASRDSIRVAGNARLLRLDPAGPDTLVLRATFVDLPQPGMLRARDSVVVAAAAYAFRADSLDSEQTEAGDTRSRLSGSPSTWVQDTQVVAQRMTMMDGSPADTLRAAGEVFVATPDTLSGRINQLSGQALLAIMESDSLRSLDIREQARAILFMESEEEGATVGFSGSGDGLRFHFRGGELDNVTFYTGVEGTYYAEDMLDQLSNLRGFIFSPDNKPDRHRLTEDFWKTWSDRTEGGESTASDPCHQAC